MPKASSESSQCCYELYPYLVAVMAAPFLQAYLNSYEIINNNNNHTNNNNNKINNVSVMIVNKRMAIIIT